MKKIFLFMLLVCPFLNVSAGGYAVAIQGIKQIGMAHTGTGFYLDPAAIFFNPGAIVQSDSTWSFTAGFSPLFTKTKYQNTETLRQYETENPMGTPLMLYGTYKITGDFSAGLGIYTPFGNGLSWEDGWAGRSLITDISFAAVFVQPTVAYRANDWLSIGAGFIYAIGIVELDRDIPAVEGTVKLEGSTGGFGFNAGIYLKPTENVSFGISYRSKVEMEIDDGDATFNVPASLTSEALGESRIIPEDKFSAMLPLISALNFGVGININEKFTIAADVNLNMWSEYEELAFNFIENVSRSTVQQKDWKNTVTYRIGGQYQINEKISARLGYYYDPSPVRNNLFTPETPSLDNHVITAGASFQVNDKLGINTSLLIINGEERNAFDEASNFGGAYKGAAISPAIGISYQF